MVVWFSIRAFKSSETIGEDLGPLDSFVTGLYETPYLIKKYFKKSFQAVEVKREDDLFEIGKLSHLDHISDSIYILHSKYINETEVNVLLQNIKTGEIALTWVIHLDNIMQDLDSVSLELDKKSAKGIGPKKLNSKISKSSRTLVIRHPLFLKDSSLIFKSQYLGFIYKIDKNSNILWKSKKLAHHSIELDENENIWTCSVDITNESSNKMNFRDDAILCLDQNGNEKHFISLTEIFQENNLFKSFIEATPIDVIPAGRDPYHLNDVQPVKNDGTYWKKGDVFLSIRNKSLVTLFNPKSRKIKWIKQGPWMMNHDVNIENDSIISIFNNNRSFINSDVNTSSNVSYYNFNSQNVSFLSGQIFSSKSEGRQTILSNGDIFIESTNSAIYYLLDAVGNLKCKFIVPYQPDSKYAQYPGWARVFLKEGNAFIEQ